MEGGEWSKSTPKGPRRAALITAGLKHVGRELLEGAKVATVDLAEKPVPVERINEETVAARVYHYRGHPQRDGTTVSHPFTKADVLTYLGYTPLFNDEDLAQRHRQAYEAVNPILYELARKGILTTEVREEADAHGENLTYAVADLVRLKELHDRVYKK